MKILIDLQGLQTASNRRGIGRSCLGLTTAILRNRTCHDIIFLLNNQFFNDIEKIKSIYRAIDESVKFVSFDFNPPVAQIEESNWARARYAELSREYLINQIGADYLLIPTLFEGFGDDAVTSVGLMPSRIPVAIVLHDLIPLINPDLTWSKVYTDYYIRKISYFKSADLFLSVSNYSKLEAAGALPEIAEKIAPISSACDPSFTVKYISQQRIDELKNTYNLTDKFIMSTGNVEPRKNYELLISAFSKLPETLIRDRKVILIGDSEENTVQILREILKEHHIEQDKLIIAGHVPDEDLKDLYGQCELFVFPSKHEGFGLPPLEAMACGAAVLASSATSLPEVIGREDALFDPTSDDQLINLLLRAYTDESYYKSLKEWGPKRAKEFSWDGSARKALDAIELSYHEIAKSNKVIIKNTTKKNVAIFCPLPPERTGIADYFWELLPYLAECQNITVITDQQVTTINNSDCQFKVRNKDWFLNNTEEFDCIIYQIGNSPFHEYMIDVIPKYPGIVVLHDFFLSSWMLWRETHAKYNHAFTNALKNSHGLSGLKFAEQFGYEAAKIKYPCNYDIISAAEKIIVHSSHNLQLLKDYYGEKFLDKAIQIPHLRAKKQQDRIASRRRLGLDDNVFLVCSFGALDKTKLNLNLLKAWRASLCNKDANCLLIFVGNEADECYHQEILSYSEKYLKNNSIRITGFVTQDVYQDYLSAVDLAVQLRTNSRGETSGTVLDCLARGIPTIVNNHGSLKEYPSDILLKIDDKFKNSQLIEALDKLKLNKLLRENLGKLAKSYIVEHHSPKHCAKAYNEVVNLLYNEKKCKNYNKSRDELIKCSEGTSISGIYTGATEWIDILNEPRRPVFYLDMTATIKNDLGTGIERVTRALLKELIEADQSKFIIMPVYLNDENGIWHHRIANSYLYTKKLTQHNCGVDTIVVPKRGDKLLTLDLFTGGVISAAKQGLYDNWRMCGANVGFVIYDILPITHPQFFPSFAPSIHAEWLNLVLTQSDFAMPISATVRQETVTWAYSTGYKKADLPLFHILKLGSDIDASLLTSGLPENSEVFINTIAQQLTFIMVGTIEPRKGHLHVLDVFHQLWLKEFPGNLVIVGKEGWKDLPVEERRTIPRIVETITNSPELNKKLFWFSEASDQFLKEIYKSANYLIAASEQEGFGLPIVEAQKHNLDVIAREIPVFREVGKNNVIYFNENTENNLVSTILNLATTYKKSNKAEKMQPIRLTEWKATARELLQFLNMNY